MTNSCSWAGATRNQPHNRHIALENLEGRTNCALLSARAMLRPRGGNGGAQLGLIRRHEPGPDHGPSLPELGILPGTSSRKNPRHLLTNYQSAYCEKVALCSMPQA